MVALARRGVAVLAVLIAILAPAALFYLPFGAAAFARESAFGTLSNILGRFVQARPTTQVRLVTIDDDTFGRAEPWPWSNERLTRLVSHLQAGAPRLMIMDLAPRANAGLRSSGDMRLDRRLSGDAALAQSALQLFKPHSANLLPLLSTEGSLIAPAPVITSAMQVARLSAVRIDGNRPRSDWSLRPPGVHRLAPIPMALTAWNTAPDGSLRLLPASAPTGLRVVSARELLAASAEPTSRVKDSVVIVRRATTAGPETAEWREAQGLAQLLNGLTLARPGWALLAEAITAAIAAGLVSLLMVFNRVHQAALAAGAAIALFFATAGALFVFRLELLDPAGPSVFVIGALALSGLALVIRRTLGANAAAPSPARASAVAVLTGVERREVTALVCEIRDLSVLTETYRDSPTAMTRLVGKVLGTAAEIIRAHRGTIENISPSGLTAVFNAPGSDARHSEKAAEAALAVLGRLDPLNESLEKSLANTGTPFTPVQFSIGIDTGDAVVGDIGFKARREFAAFGPALDAAKTLADYSTTYGPAILVGDKTEALINRNFALLELDLREAPNSNTRSFYALLGNPVLRANPRFKALQEGFRAFHAAYRKASWEQASQLLAQCAKLPGVSPKLIALYEQRIAYLGTSPQLRDWSGVLRRPVE